jgi:hypothetical protein
VPGRLGPDQPAGGPHSLGTTASPGPRQVDRPYGLGGDSPVFGERCRVADRGSGLEQRGKLAVPDPRVLRVVHHGDDENAQTTDGGRPGSGGGRLRGHRAVQTEAS